MATGEPATSLASAAPEEVERDGERVSDVDASYMLAVEQIRPMSRRWRWLAAEGEAKHACALEPAHDLVTLELRFKTFPNGAREKTALVVNYVMTARASAPSFIYATAQLARRAAHATLPVHAMLEEGAATRRSDETLERGRLKGVQAS